MKKESLYLLLEIRDTIYNECDDLMKLLIGDAPFALSKDDGIIGKLSFNIEAIIRKEVDEDLLIEGKDGFTPFFKILNSKKLTNHEKVDLLLGGKE